ncbi:siderophore-interacting protein [Neotabrizicola sp. VNH66]|uniref:siderophore-interacting protein n=1 Tax=Neotabrizicola sp. VNH66 TaxID=3400918 RepID=UPI003C01955F
MARPQSESVEDRNDLLSQDDHMREMERLTLTVTAIARPAPSVARVTGRIVTHQPEAWAQPNVAVRIEVECPPGERPISRVYTIRSFDALTGLAEIDFVLHEDDSPAMRWLSAARPGTQVFMTGPRQHFVPAHLPDRRAAVLADETALPAVHAILTAWPSGAPGTVWVETGDAAAFAELPKVNGVDLHLLSRRPDQPPGSTGRLFATARAALSNPAGWTLWAAGERQEMRDIRSHFRAAGMARDDLRVFGYWKRGASSSDLDRIRLSEYEALRAAGGRLEQFRDEDLPI